MREAAERKRQEAIDNTIRLYLDLKGLSLNDNLPLHLRSLFGELADKAQIIKNVMRNIPHTQFYCYQEVESISTIQ